MQETKTNLKMDWFWWLDSHPQQKQYTLRQRLLCRSRCCNVTDWNQERHCHQPTSFARGPLQSRQEIRCHETHAGCRRDLGQRQHKHWGHLHADGPGSVEEERGSQLSGRHRDVLQTQYSDDGEGEGPRLLFLLSLMMSLVYLVYSVCYPWVIHFWCMSLFPHCDALCFT